MPHRRVSLEHSGALYIHTWDPIFYCLRDTFVFLVINTHRHDWCICRNSEACTTICVFWMAVSLWLAAQHAAGGLWCPMRPIVRPMEPHRQLISAHSSANNGIATSLTHASSRQSRTASKVWLITLDIHHSRLQNREWYWCQLCRHWWQKRLSLWQPPLPPLTTKLVSWRLAFCQCIWGVYGDFNIIR